MVISKNEIEAELKTKGDFVQIDYLGRLLKKDLATDIRKFVYLKLAEIYEKKILYSDGAKMLESAAAIATTNSERARFFTKETELYIKAGFFERAEEAMRKAMNEAKTNVERDIVYNSVKEFYKNQAATYEREKRRNQAVKVYEELLKMKISEEEKEKIKVRLEVLYEQLGKLKEYFAMKNNKIKNG